MFARLPKTIDPFREAERQSQYSGVLELAKLPRLAAVMTSEAGELQCEFELYREERNFWVIGRFSSVLHLECQRCLEPFDMPIERQFKLRIEKAERVDDDYDHGYESIVVEDGQLDVMVMIEDEVLLAMPSFPKHLEVKECNWRADALEKGEGPKRSNPFDVLESLKKH